MPRAVLIYNPSAGRGGHHGLAEEVAAILRQAGLAIDLRPTLSAAEATAAAHEAASRRVDRLLALGGDGTLRAAARGLLGSEVALAPIPAGTTNVVARALGLPLAPLRAARALTAAEPRASDVGLCIDREGRREVFLMQASLGLDAAIMAAAGSRAKQRGGLGAVALLGLRTWWRYGYPEIHFRADGVPGTATLLVAANIAHYGGDHRIAPEAGFSTHRLHLVTFGGRSRLAAIGFALALARGRHLAMPETTCRPVDEVIIEPPAGDPAGRAGAAPLQLDGDALSLAAPLTLRLAEERLLLLVPSAGGDEASD